jgi:hypothetical protein
MTFLALGTVILGAGGCFPEHGDKLVLRALGERTQVAFLPFAGLIVGADLAVDGDLSQLDPPAVWLV